MDAQEKLIKDAVIELVEEGRKCSGCGRTRSAATMSADGQSCIDCDRIDEDFREER